MTFYKNYLQTIETRKIHLTFSYEKDENYLIEKLERLGINKPDIEHLRSNYLEFYGQFSSLLHNH